MHKTKRTLVISSVVMMLVLVVAIVSATAAWFSNFADSKQDGFIIDSTTITESASIDISEDANSINGYGLSVWPAVSKPGYLSKGGIAPTGADLKNVIENQTIKEARCAVLYFSIQCTGNPDKDSDSKVIDGRKSLSVDVNSATIKLNGSSENSVQQKDYLSEFNVEMELVSIDENDGEKNATALPKNDDPKVNSVYYIQNSPSEALYMLVKPGDTYYVKATIYFNKVDEECLDELIHFGTDENGDAVQKIEFVFDISYSMPNGVDIRNGNLTPTSSQS